MFVSLRATEPDLQVRLPENSGAGLLMQQLDWFAERDLQLHAEVVICPGLNDVADLERILRVLSCFDDGEDRPSVLSAAVVPVGLTPFRPADDGLAPMDPICARQVIAQVKALQVVFQRSLGTRFAWLSDEWYLLAGLPLPPRKDYEDLPDQVDGMRPIDAFLEALDLATVDLPQRVEPSRHCSWVVGRIVGTALRPVTERLNAVDGVSLQLHRLPSPFWKRDRPATFELTGYDLIDGLAGRDLGEELLLPSAMLRQGQPVSLFDMPLDTLRERLAVPIRVVHAAADVVASVLSPLGESP